MYSLDLKMVDPPGDPIPDKTFALLRDFLQPDSNLRLESVARSIEDFLPENAPLSTEVWDFGESCIEVAEQIPYYHPSQLKLTGLLEYLANSPKLGRAHNSKVGYFQVYRSLNMNLRLRFLGYTGPVCSIPASPRVTQGLAEW